VDSPDHVPEPSSEAWGEKRRQSPSCRGQGAPRRGRSTFQKDTK
jgi:hypothetical protein